MIEKSIEIIFKNKNLSVEMKNLLNFIREVIKKRKDYYESK